MAPTTRILTHLFIISCLVACKDKDDTGTAPNHAPEIVSYTDGGPNCGTNEKNILCLSSETIVFVIVDDDDGDMLSFEWSLSQSGSVESAENTAQPSGQVSEIALIPEDVVDGETLRCMASDGNESESVEWTLSLP